MGYLTLLTNHDILRQRILLSACGDILEVTHDAAFIARYNGGVPRRHPRRHHGGTPGDTPAAPRRQPGGAVCWKRPPLWHCHAARTRQ